jgi:DNA-binding GntR family transcriptional regulator
MSERQPGSRGGEGASSIAKAIYQGLCQEITTGVLKPGELLSRRRIAERYGCSYTPVIEALVRLEHSGLIEAESSQMARVRKETVETIQSNYILREAYETQAIRLACESATQQEIDDLYRLAEQVDAQMPGENRRAVEPGSEGLSLHWRFHKRIAEISRVPALLRELERIELLVLLQAIWHYFPEFSDPYNWHSLLVDTIRDRDPEAADEAMRLHVRMGLQKVLKGYRVKSITPGDRET